MTELRLPRLQILADGVLLPGAIAASVSSNNHFGADIWQARLALSAAPGGLSVWDTRTTSLIDIQIGLGASGWVSLVNGQIDSLSADPVEGVVTIGGRDLTAVLIEARTREAFANQTASDVATLLAGRHGLTPQVTATTTPIGRYYSDDHERLTLDRYTRASTEWDLLVWLAQQESFDTFVAATTLFFQPSNPTPSPTMVLQASAHGSTPPNISALQVMRAMTLSGPIDVTVKSWNSQQQTSIVETASRAGSGTVRNYAYLRPNMSSSAALAMAQQKLAAIIDHEYVIIVDMPGELTLSPRDCVTLAGTGSSFDQSYQIDEIIRCFDLNRGFMQTIRARTASQTAA